MSYTEERDNAAKKYAESQINYRPEHLGLKAACFSEGHDAGLQCEVVRGLAEVTQSTQCACNIRERESGHITGCWMPDLIEKLEAYKSALREIGAKA